MFTGLSSTIRLVSPDTGTSPRPGPLIRPGPGGRGVVREDRAQRVEHRAARLPIALRDHAVGRPPEPRVLVGGQILHGPYDHGDVLAAGHPPQPREELEAVHLWHH